MSTFVNISLLSGSSMGPSKEKCNEDNGHKDDATATNNMGGSQANEPQE